jgi:hypothetical protein
MKEFTYPNEVYIKEIDMNVRPYITFAEKKEIAKNMLEVDYMDREFVLNCDILHICAGISNDDNVDYDLLVVNNVMTIICDYCPQIQMGIADIWEFVEKSDSIEATAKRLEEDINVSLQSLVEFMDKASKKIPSQAKLEKAMKYVADKMEVNPNGDNR